MAAATTTTTPLDWRLSRIEDELNRWTTGDVQRYMLDPSEATPAAAAPAVEAGNGSPSPKTTNSGAVRKLAKVAFADDPGAIEIGGRNATAETTIRDNDDNRIKMDVGGATKAKPKVKPALRTPPPPPPTPPTASSKKSAAIRFFTAKYDKPSTTTTTTTAPPTAASTSLPAAESVAGVRQQSSSSTSLLPAERSVDSSIQTQTCLGGGSCGADVSSKTTAPCWSASMISLPSVPPQTRIDRPVARIVPAMAPVVPVAARTPPTKLDTAPLDRCGSMTSSGPTWVNDVTSEGRRTDFPRLADTTASPTIVDGGRRQRPTVPDKPAAYMKKLEPVQRLESSASNTDDGSSRDRRFSANLSSPQSTPVTPMQTAGRSRVTSTSTNEGGGGGSTAIRRRLSSTASNDDDVDDDDWSASWFSGSETDVASCGRPETPARRDSSFFGVAGCMSGRATGETTPSTGEAKDYSRYGRRFRVHRRDDSVSASSCQLVVDDSPSSLSTADDRGRVELVVLTRRSKNFLPKSKSLFEGIAVSPTPSTKTSVADRLRRSLAYNEDAVADETASDAATCSSSASARDDGNLSSSSAAAPKPIVTAAAVCVSGVSDDYYRGADTSSSSNAPATDSRMTEIQSESALSSSSGDPFNRVELFFRSRATRVFVARSLARLFVGRSRVVGIPSTAIVDATTSAALAVGHRRSLSVGGTARTAGDADWTPVGTGVPVFVLDTGEGRRRRRLSVVLADRLTGFVTWTQTVDHLTEYRSVVVSESSTETAASPPGTCIGVHPVDSGHHQHHSASSARWHTMRLSADHSRLAAFRFDDPSAADDFIGVMRSLTSDPDDPLLAVSRRRRYGGRASGGKKTAAAARKSMSKPVPVTKASISAPCCFDHVTRLMRQDALRMLNDE